jgi:GT2 family glycosyltransferase
VASVSVVVTTFRWPQALRAVLAGLAAQSDRDFETVVADDGSGPETAAELRAAAPGLRGGLVHVWHPDRGFRAGPIRNRGVAAARGEYLVFLDGDSIPRPGFVATHRAAARRGWAIRGRRALLSARLTGRVLAGDIDAAAATTRELLRWRRSGDLNRLLPFVVPVSVSLPSVRTALGLGLHWKHARTVNFAAWRGDLERVNGFDERFTGWGFEDSDLAIRLGRAGVRLGALPGAGTVLHLHHRESDRSLAGENLARLREIERAASSRAELGFDRVDPEARVERLS